MVCLWEQQKKRHYSELGSIEDHARGFNGRIAAGLAAVLDIAPIATEATRCAGVSPLLEAELPRTNREASLGPLSAPTRLLFA